MAVRIERWHGLADNGEIHDPWADVPAGGETVGENIDEEIAAREAGVQAGTAVADTAERVNEMPPSREGEGEPAPIDSTAMWIGVGLITVGALFFVMIQE